MANTKKYHYKLPESAGTQLGRCGSNSDGMWLNTLRMKEKSRSKFQSLCSNWLKILQTQVVHKTAAGLYCKGFVDTMNNKTYQT